MREWLWGIIASLYPCWLRLRYRMDIGTNCVISWKAHLDKSVNPKGIQYMGAFRSDDFST